MTEEQGKRRSDRAASLVGTPFVRLPGNPPDHRVLFTATDGTKIKVKDVEMVFNDALLLDAVNNWGQDGPLYEQTLDGDPPLQREVFEYALKAYKGIDLPPQLRRPS